MEKSLPTNNKRKALMNQSAIRYDNHLISTQPNMDANTTTATPENENNPLPTRFEVELEFVQSLANIPYVTYLFTQQQTKENNNFNWKSPEFKNYLKYLEYWCQPPYSQCIVYPNALHVLKLINGFFEANATVNEDGLLDGVDELPRFLQLQGPHIMNEMVNRWEQ